MRGATVGLVLNLRLRYDHSVKRDDELAGFRSTLADFACAVGSIGWEGF
jgi:hypothetical protein